MCPYTPSCSTPVCCILSLCMLKLFGAGTFYYSTKQNNNYNNSVIQIININWNALWFFCLFFLFWLYAIYPISHFVKGAKQRTEGKNLHLELIWQIRGKGLILITYPLSHPISFSFSSCGVQSILFLLQIFLCHISTCYSVISWVVFVNPLDNFSQIVVHCHFVSKNKVHLKLHKK